MEFLKIQYQRMQELLAGLSATQKMLTASLVAIMIMTLLWWSRYAAEPEMDSVVSQALSADEIGAITSHLDAKGIHYRVSGGQVLVPVDRKMEVLADLTYSQALPRTVKLPFDEMLPKISALDPPELVERMMLEAKQRTLAMVISNFPGVSSAVVVIDPTSDQRFDKASVEPSAMVNVTTRRDGKCVPKQVANASADIVSGAVAGLSRSRINIVIDGIPFAVRDQDIDDPGSGDAAAVVEMKRQYENFYGEKIRSEFAFIRGLMVSVTVKVTTASEKVSKHEVDPKDVYSAPVETHEHTEETAGGGGGAEPGAASNTGVNASMTLGPSSGGGTTSSVDDNTQTMINDHAHTDTEMTQPPGDATVIAASVRVPRSYLIESYKSANNEKEPDAAALAAYSSDELGRIRKAVKADTGIASDEAVVVDAYVDPKPVEPTAAAAVSSGPGVWSISRYGKEIGVGVLAAISLLMMSMMVRKGSPAGAIAAQATAEPRKLGPGADVAGEVSESGAMLDGMELDEETLKTQSMLDQVQQMVQENPDAAANLVKRWLSHS